MANLDKTTALIAATDRQAVLVPQWRIEEKRRERQHRTNIVSNTVLASAFSERRDDEPAEA